jgi:hypothetical protein
VENPLFEQACRRAVSLEMDGAIIREPSKGVLFVNSMKILLKTPILLHLTKRLYAFCGGRIHQVHPATEVRA